MPFVPVANTVLAEFRQTCDTQQVENTLYFEFLSAPSLGELNSLGSALVDWWRSEIAPHVWVGVELREVVLSDLSSASSLQATIVPTPDALGELNLAPLPNNVSLTVSFRTGLRGRSFRGRNYVIGLVKDQTVTANTFASSLLTTFQAAYTALLAVASAESVSWVVVSRFSGVDGAGHPIPRAAGVTTPVTSVVIVDDVVDSQRRRLPGRGN